MAHSHVVEPGKPVHLKSIDPRDTNGTEKTAAIEQEMAEDLRRLGELQELLYVAQTHAVLVVLQGTDTSGKDGTIRHVFGGVSPLGCSVTAFKIPSTEEQAHDYLWRIHAHCPPKGMVGIFNRSHYESVLVERVHDIIGHHRCEQRYDEINAFEQTLSREGVIILKFFLHISSAEQEERLKERMITPTKQWKASPGDWAERKRWDEYQSLYEEMLNRTSTEWAPWTVVPADHKWFRNLAVAKRLISVLEEYEKDWARAVLDRGAEAMQAIAAEQ